jgi:hypothetical protein
MVSRWRMEHLPRAVPLARTVRLARTTCAVRLVRAAHVTRVAAGVCVLLLGGCELATETVASPRAAVVVHAVLNPDVAEQVILLESSLTGRVAIDSMLRFNPLDPIRTAGGEPLTHAEVRLHVDGDSSGVEATETELDGRRTGRYVVPRTRLTIQPGRAYRLQVRTADGRVVTGDTRVPSAGASGSPARGATALGVTLNRSRDTLRLEWDVVPDARTYAIRVETPNGPWFLFSDSTRFALTGQLRNFFVGGLPSVWYPGFDQTVSVAAVDRNFYDYNRSGNDPFGGTGLISSVRGGFGLFGSVVVLLRREVTVLERDRFPLDARWRGVTASGTLVEYDLWVESMGAPRASVSGREQRGARRFLVGTLDGSQLRLVTLVGTSSADTAALFTGRVSGESITGSYDPRFETRGATQFVRQARSAP